MEDWQGCLTPVCQQALQAALRQVRGRHGCAITVEDFLLALLESAPALVRFLRARGVDQDELVRTIQCEQPTVTALAGNSQLSSQLQYWLALARELSPRPWLDWPRLLQTLTVSAERLQDKAYVAVLEQVSRWPDGTSDTDSADNTPGHPCGATVLITDPDWLALAEDVRVALMMSDRALVWVSGPAGIGKSAWLAGLAPIPDRPLEWLHWQGGGTSTWADAPAQAPVPTVDSARPSVLVLDQVSPGELCELLDKDGSELARRLGAHAGPILLVGRCRPEVSGAVQALECRLGRTLQRLRFPLPGRGQLTAVVHAHQPCLEKRWQVRIESDALARVVAAWPDPVDTPGKALAILERAAVRKALRLRQGQGSEAIRLAGEVQLLRQRLLIGLARQQPVAELERVLHQLCLQQTAAEVSWQEELHGGALDDLRPQDVEQELMRLPWPDGAECLVPGCSVARQASLCSQNRGLPGSPEWAAQSTT
ncbi:hypothetical protein [Marinobacter xestospongiae]|uniref:Clp amino terminal domain-containing protein, pathogenicity island component n=1 Tax=Marinobacter xestospongiae TaxID=994319 RepID=A0ABU3VTT0_9GAMM|nr:hypothetical protein [Marinobacter xestospongiae]MDV2077683.1 hypothetical protein [Marinobacter xestospongiae]